MKEISYTPYGQLIFPNDNKSKDNIKLLDLSEFWIDQKYLTSNFLNTQNYVIWKKIINVDNSIFSYRDSFYKASWDISLNKKIEEKKKKIDPNSRIIEVEKDFYFSFLKDYKEMDSVPQQIVIWLVILVFVLLFALSTSNDIIDIIWGVVFLIIVLILIVLFIIPKPKHDYYVFRTGPNKILLIRK